MLSFVELSIVYILILFTLLFKVIIEKINTSTIIIKKPLMDSYLSDALQYTKNIIDFKDFKLLTENEQNLFIGHAIGYMKLNYNDVLKELGMLNSDERICSLLLSKLK